MQRAPSHKILIIGSGGCGKTAFVQKLVTGNFDQKYIATLGVEVHPYYISETNGNGGRKLVAHMNLWDLAGQERFCGLAEGYYREAQGAIFAFDLTSLDSLKVLEIKLARFGYTNPGVPVVICGMKKDIANPEVQAKAKHLFQGFSYVEVSSKFELPTIPVETLVDLISVAPKL